MKFRVLSVQNDLAHPVPSNFSNLDEYFDSVERYYDRRYDDRFLRKIELEPGDEVKLLDIIRALNRFSYGNIGQADVEILDRRRNRQRIASEEQLIQLRQFGFRIRFQKYVSEIFFRVVP